MELQGKVIAVLEPRQGESMRGPWKSQEYVIETHDQYPKKMVFNIFGAEKIDQFAIKAGEELLVSFDIDAHEYNGRWFNNVRAWNIQRVENTINKTKDTNKPDEVIDQNKDPFSQNEEDDDDLPF